MELYPEFTPIYIGGAVILILLLVILILLIIMLMKVVKLTRGGRGTMKAGYAKGAEINSSKSVVFCKNCATEYDASEKCCPKCGTHR